MPRTSTTPTPTPRTRPRPRPSTRPDGPPEPLTAPAVASVEDLRQVKAALVPLRAELGLHRFTPAERARLRVTQDIFQIKKSLACLRLLKKRPDLAARLNKASPGALEALIDLRLSLAQARNALDGTIKATERGELFLIAQLTAGCDRIEDHLLSWMTRDGATEDEQRRLRAKFDDPARIRESFTAFVEARRLRRQRRRALSTAELAEHKARYNQTLDREHLASSDLPARRGK
jgi:hypothetical protein